MTPSPEPTVTVVIPAFNTAPYVGDAIQSALAQTFRDLEVVVVDDGSTDATCEIARTWARADARVRIIANAETRGTGAARNTVMQAARGRFFALLDSDDIWLPEFLATQLSAFDEFPDAAVVTGNAWNLGGAFDGQPYRPMPGGRRRVSMLEMIEREDAICVMSVFRREVAETIGGFDETLRRNEDYDFWLRAAAAGFVFVQTPEPVACYRRREGSVSADHLKMIAGIILVLEKTYHLCGNRPAERNAINRQIERFHREELAEGGKAALRAREFRVAADCFRALSERQPGVTPALIAAASRYAPRSLLWIDRLRRRFRVLARIADHERPADFARAADQLSRHAS